ncbi:MAG: biotin/lipoyl-containing protein, partial [Saprospiraceae bacterium]
PMPGMVLDVLVETGQSVESGQPVLILEAMKMENIIKTASAGTVEILNATQGDSVEKGQLLVVLKPNDQ